MGGNTITWVALAFLAIVFLLVFVVVIFARRNHLSESESSNRRVPFSTLFTIYRNGHANTTTLNREFTEPLPLYNSYRAQTQVLNAITVTDSNGLPPSYSNSEEVNQQPNNTQ